MTSAPRATPTPPTTTLADGIRHRFPIFERRTYVNSCSHGALSDSVRAAYDGYLAGLEDQGAPWDTWVGEQERVRALVARLLGADSAEVAVTTSASAGLNAVASAFDFSGPRDTVVVTDAEFPTVGQIWHATERRGARVVHVPRAADRTLPIEHFEKVIDDRTAVVSVTDVCYQDGARTDLTPVIELAHERGARVVADVFQSAGTVPLDVGALGADFVVGGMQKYLLGAPGAAYLYASAERTADYVPVHTGWFAAEDIFAMKVDGYEPAPDARRFESGTPPVPCLYAASAGLELLLDVGIEATAAHLDQLTAQLRSGIAGIGGTVVTPPPPASAAMVAVAASDDHAYVAALAEERVVVSCRAGNVRISPHCYNTPGDIDTVLAALYKHRHLLRR
ncbi:aminotransferase class V-fold PLP-dependent enzyme [Phytoactinopolyspora limicola]|uniref:aminotransferase class V-fold PLP-dependent enzyme n=1 Tax=Phytoactinopolyspora limicola TaxID=2715536 RepID=UPI001409CA2B|nr:aminotransferase class V-fold PLP-dependent enzyme [Phytoactinopolyspora limicola]